MKWQAKAGIVGGILLLIMALLVVIKIQYDSIQKLKTIETSVVESKDLGKDIKRAQAAYLTKDELKRLIKDEFPDMELVKKDLRKLGADIEGIHTVKVYTPGFSGTDIGSTDSTPNPNPPDPNKPVIDEYGYLGSTQWLELKEPFSEEKPPVPWGKVGFSAWKEKPWTLEVKPRQYSSTTILGVDEDGRNYAYSRVTIKVDGEEYPVPITESKIREEYPRAKFRFSPTVFMGIDAGAIANPPAHAEITPNVGVSLFSFGKTKINPTFSFVGLGLGYATQHQAPVLTVSPVNYNIGEPLPLVRNLYVGPSLSLDVDGNVGLYIGLKVNL